MDFVIETEIGRTPEEVFEYVSDPAKLDSWQTNTVSAEPEQPGPLGVGSRIREVHRAGGKNMASLVEIVEYEPNRVFGMRVIEGPAIHGRITFEPSPHGTKFQFRVYGHPTSLMRLAAPILKPVLKRNFKGYCANLKRLLENQSSEP